jgi:hypothetical protein
VRFVANAAVVAARLALCAPASPRQNERPADYIRFKLIHDIVFHEVAPATFAVRASCEGVEHRRQGLRCGYCTPSAGVGGGRKRGAAQMAPPGEHAPLRCPRCGSDDTHFLAFSVKNVHGVRPSRHACKVRRRAVCVCGGRRGLFRRRSSVASAQRGLIFCARRIR